MLTKPLQSTGKKVRSIKDSLLMVLRDCRRVLAQRSFEEFGLRGGRRGQIVQVMQQSRASPQKLRSLHRLVRGKEFETRELRPAAVFSPYESSTYILEERQGLELSHRGIPNRRRSLAPSPLG